MWILALDVGTSSIRAIGYDALGRPLPGADAQALGDLQALRDAGRRVVRVRLTGKQTHGVEQLIQVLQKTIKKK